MVSAAVFAGVKHESTSLFEQCGRWHALGNVVIDPT